ncbi:hypothetical protein [Prosthecobacter sp.]|uniref:hypothetical protein n=1 Tax=Prosthecobacter sp. TaxID=1965333 RepID=UPI001DD78D02|nr:hypothetical protein [Prosthecobacter sp.]MCB1278569.1 hypothetical protein [Prosthecobacter sp.]
MKTSHILSSVLILTTLTSCFVTPMGPRARSPYSPGGRAVLPGERNPHSPYSPGGVVVLPREARRVYHGGAPYYTHRGVWYRPHGHGFVVCPRPY